MNNSPSDPRLGIAPSHEQNISQFYSTAMPGEVALNHAVVYFANVIYAYCDLQQDNDPISRNQGTNHLIGVRLPDACRSIQRALAVMNIHPGPFYDDLLTYYSDMRAAALRFAPDLSGLILYLLDKPSS